MERSMNRRDEQERDTKTGRQERDDAGNYKNNCSPVLGHPVHVLFDRSFHPFLVGAIWFMHRNETWIKIRLLKRKHDPNSNFILNYHLVPLSTVMTTAKGEDPIFLLSSSTGIYQFNLSAFGQELVDNPGEAVAMDYWLKDSVGYI
jgi:hypothetical protein